MPEGDTIFRTATTLRPAMEGGVIADAQIRDRQFECERIIGSTVAKVEPRGKHLLMHLTSDSAPSTAGTTLVIHSHLGMTGSWHVYRAGQPWRKPAQYAALILAINQLEVICFSPRLLELLTADQLRRHPHLQNLGPDLLGVEFDIPQAIHRFRLHNQLPLGEAVMNQRIVCGIGNVYKSDLLFLMGFDPLAAVERFADIELSRMLQKAQFLMRRNLTGTPRKTRYGSDAGRLWVYGRVGQPCPKCGTIIQLQRQGDAGRTTFWCPACQPAR